MSNFVLLSLLFAASARGIVDPPLFQSPSDLVGPHSVANELDCALRNLSCEYGLYLGTLAGAAPAMAAPFETLFDALRLLIDCNISLSETSLAANKTKPLKEERASERSPRSSAAIYYADPVHGSDGNPGTIASPFKTVGRALEAARAGPAPAAIVLRAGTFFLPATLVLGPQDSGLSLSSFPGESVMLSGGAPLLNLSWARTTDPPSPPITQPISASLLDWNGTTCITEPGATNPGICVPLLKTPEVSACIDACLASADCTGYTWHDNSTGEWAGWCYARQDGYNIPAPLAGHESAWKVAPSAIWAAPLPEGSPAAPFDQIFVGKVRAIRARWPNGNPEETISPIGFTSALGWLPPAAFPAPTEVHVNAPNRSSYDPFFPYFQWGFNGSVGNFTSGSFWGTKNPPAGAQYKVPSGLILPPSAPNASTWGIDGALVHAFHGDLWGGWTFTVDPSGGPPSDVNGTLSFLSGGWQEARGCSSGNGFYVENVRELLDVAGEWFFDATDRTLFMSFNESSAPNASALVASQLATIISVEGTSENPVLDLTISGITFSHTLTDYLLPYTVPSGGDWSFHAGGALSLVGSVGATIKGCTFTRLGGNGLFVGGFSRDALISGNEFSYTGASAIVVAGLKGFNISGGWPDYPNGTRVIGNLARELGLYVKQSGFLYQAISGNSTISSNVFTNGPRAGINFNDGFSGGHLVSGNLGLNFVRETADHGVLNTWDRNYENWRSWDNTTIDILPTHIQGNFFTNNYHSTWCLDHDDGSNGFIDSGNVLPWSGSKNYLGFAKAQLSNFYIFPDYSPVVLAGRKGSRVPLANGYGTCAVSSSGTSSFPVAFRDTWYNNTCLQEKSEDLFAFGACEPQSPNDGHIPILANNSYATGDGAYLLRCGNLSWTLADAQAAGIELGSQLIAMPDTASIIAMAREMLQF